MRQCEISYVCTFFGGNCAKVRQLQSRPSEIGTRKRGGKLFFFGGGGGCSLRGVYGDPAKNVAPPQ